MGDRQVVQIFCKGNDKLNVAIRDGKLVLAPANDDDKTQLWYKDYRFTGNVTDDEARRPFTLSNVKTGQVNVNKHIQRPDLNYVSLQLAPYHGGEIMNVSMLWTEGQDLGDEFCEVRTVRDIKWTLNGIFGNVKDGTEVGIYPSTPQAINSIWKMTVKETNVSV
ncbi:hypothetical protein QOZ80_5BG0438350 [Eleusine coracana subsp. coracana]|nr:hypothetical protein QOZ80_5BG0438350 [Eleusine coracana subsp. coracana]